MGALLLYLFDFGFCEMGSESGYRWRKIVVVLLGFLGSVSTGVVVLYGFVCDLFFRLQGMFMRTMRDWSSLAVFSRIEGDGEADDGFIEDINSNRVCDPDGVERELGIVDCGSESLGLNREVIKDAEEEVTESFLTFRFPRFEEVFSTLETDGAAGESSVPEKPLKNEAIHDEDKDDEGLQDLTSDEATQNGEDIVVSSDCDSDDASSSDKFSIRSSLLHGSGDGFLLESRSDFSDFEDDELTEELANLEEGCASHDLADDREIPEGQKGSQTGDASSNSEPDEQLDSAEVEVNTNNPSDSFSEDSNALETLWEHQELVDQLKMEIRKVRVFGLPTIFEDSDSSKWAMSDLKPWKIEDEFQKNQYQGTILEIHKFYKSYRERMRKFDIFNYQKTYTIDFLGLKNPLERFSIGRRSASSLAAIMWQDCWPCKPKASEQPTPVTKYSKELDCNLEMIYVGQLCLSWEFLHWEYGKALELWDSDPHGFLQYNEVAGEFQQFQVLLQRFVEDEPFKGPRVQNYAKTRCHQQHLLQVPVIRAVSKAVTYIIMQSYVFLLEPLNSEVSTALWLSLSGYKLPRQYLYDEECYVLIFIAEDRGKGRKTVTGKGGVTSSMLVEIMEESIRIFWKFICADKYAHGIISKCRIRSNVQSSDAIDAQLFMEVQDCARKRRKILAELSRRQKGIRKIFQKQEGSEDRVLYFFCQVDLRLVLRVLNMLKITTDQLIWCSNKLNKGGYTVLFSLSVVCTVFIDFGLKFIMEGSR
ncbi:hypothetical protein AKJ16_DCAP10410, partial [Drosera capensis]